MAKRKGRKKGKKVLKKYIKMYIEGETEETYLLKLAQKYRFKLDIEPEFINNLPKGKETLKHIEKQLKKDIKNTLIQEIHLAIELDHYINSNYLKQIESFIQRVKNLGINNIYLINPCIELWFLSHFKSTDKQFINCPEVVKYIKDNLCSILDDFIRNLQNQNWIKNNYSHIFYGDIDIEKANNLKSKLTTFKNEFCEDNKFNYKKDDDEFLKRLIDLNLEKFAIYNGKKLGKFSFQEKNSSLEIYKLIEYLLQS